LPGHGTVHKYLIYFKELSQHVEVLLELLRAFGAEQLDGEGVGLLLGEPALGGGEAGGDEIVAGFGGVLRLCCGRAGWGWGDSGGAASIAAAARSRGGESPEAAPSWRKT